MDFITIDFEIANNHLNSACSMGLAFVKNNTIIDEKYYLIQPPTLEFDEEMTRVHGLTAEDVREAKKFNEIWEEIKAYFTDIPVVAHNAQFDMSVLHSCLKTYSLELPEFPYICSIPISAKACGNEKVGQSLKDRLDYFQIELTDHHNAIADAVACAKLVTTCVEVKRKKSLQTYCKVHSSIPVKMFSELKPQVYFKMKKKTPNNRFKNRVAISEITASVDSYNEDHPLYGKNVVFTGDLETIDRKAAMQRVVDRGGLVKSGVSKKTNYLVVGQQDKTLVGSSGISSKEKKAYDLMEQGMDIIIIREAEFLSLIEE
ncbi:exonuclease domain-containing protein [Bacillus tuaregi]|uniref:exonuclease domain-containing protein n=1 Tax=Bacillus tuaregi TaxID=1816695 RepID=UPI0008F8C096|nr:exonuclease domain-containing protein [Bacillus tuaregi]